MATHEKVIREKFAARLTEWWSSPDTPADPEVVATAVDELMADLGYTVKRPSLRKVDPVAYRAKMRPYMRQYQAKRRAEAKAAAKATVG